MSDLPQLGEALVAVVGGQDLLSGTTAQNSTTIVIGPEGGLDLKDISSLKASSIIHISLGTTVLRMETAAIVSGRWLQQGMSK